MKGRTKLKIISKVGPK